MTSTAQQRVLAGKGIDEATFMAALAHFPRVRGPDYVGPENLPQAKAKAPAAAVVAAAPTDYASANEFWSGLKAFLAQHYSAEDAVAIQRSFQKAHFEMLDKLSLEEFEDLAKAFDASS